MFGLTRSAGPHPRLALLWQVEVDEFILDVAWSPSGQQLAFVTVEGRIFLVSHADTSGQLKELGSHNGGANGVAWRSDGRELATAGQDGLVKIWDPHTAALAKELPAGDRWVAKVAYHPRQLRLASAAGRQVKIWGANHQLEYESADHASTIADLGWNPDGSAVALAAYYGITLHVPGRQAQPRKFAWKGSSLVLAWSPKSQFIATGEQDSTVHFWHVKTGKDAQMWGYPAKVLELAWHPSGLELATGGGEQIVIWDCSGKGPEGRKPKMLAGHPVRISQLAYQHAGDLLLSGDSAGSLLLWQPDQSRRPLAEHPCGSAITRLVWSPNDVFVAVGQRAGTLTIFRQSA